MHSNLGIMTLCFIGTYRVGTIHPFPIGPEVIRLLIWEEYSLVMSIRRMVLGSLSEMSFNMIIFVCPGRYNIKQASSIKLPAYIYH